jgi:type I restriction enzyme S subunit
MLSGKRVFEQKREPAAADDEQLSVTQKHGVMPQNLFMVMDDRKVTLALAGTDNFKHVDEGDFVISLRSFEGGIELSQYKGCISPAYTCLRARKPIGEGYYKFTMKSKDFISALQSVTQGIRDGKNISYAEFSKLSIPYPPVEEQTAIASFLDRETAKIDALIAEQQRLIELLKEKRQAVISHAVTKGLNPNALMKDSGVEWLGEVPEHWKIIKGSRIGRLFGSEQLSEEKVQTEGDIPFLKVSTLTDDSFEAKEPEWFVNRSDVRAGQGSSGFLVFPKRGAAIFGNKVNVVHRESLIDPNLMGWTVNEENSPVYYGYLLKTRRLDEIADVSTVPQINNKHINQEQWPSPPRSEQSEIEEFLLGATSRYDDLTSLASKAIGVLSERRSALISAAVTGQIDVRGLATEEEP